METSVKVKLYKEHQLEILKKQFPKSLSTEYRIELFNNKTKEWYNLEWMEFKKELLKSGEKLPFGLQNDLQKYFNKHKKKVLSLSKELCRVKFDLMKTG